eukprot:4083728-Prymnesium_polylepis.1
MCEITSRYCCTFWDPESKRRRDHTQSLFSASVFPKYSEFMSRIRLKDLMKIVVSLSEHCVQRYAT